MILCKPTEAKPLVDTILSSSHALIAGTTGSGKSCLLNNVIHQILEEPTDKVGALFIDLKRVEFSKYKNDPHTVGVVTEPEDVMLWLNAALHAMDKEYARMEAGKPSNQDMYIIIDELAYTVEIPGVVDALANIGRLGRAAGCHLICATQDPSRRTLPAKIMQNFTCCVALRCRSAIESRQIVGVPGAEKLPKYGKGILWNEDGITNVRIPEPIK